MVAKSANEVKPNFTKDGLSRNSRAKEKRQNQMSTIIDRKSLECCHIKQASRTPTVDDIFAFAVLIFDL